VLPRVPREEAHRVAALVLGDGRPLAAPLRSHPRAALLRRLYWAIALPGLAAAVLAWLGQSGAVAGWVWLIPITAVPAIVPLSFVAYRSLGHALVGPYLVLRSGLSKRSTAVLRCDAVVGWTVRQTAVQRALGLMTIGAATAAGTRYYELPDLSAGQAVEFVSRATPQLVQDFLT
jgi:putative membrane protein